MPLSAEERFERAWSQAEPAVWKVALVFTRDREKALDLMGDARLRAWKFFPSYDEQRSFTNWAVRILVRQWINTVSRRAPVVARSLDDSREDGEGRCVPIEVEDQSDAFAQRIDVIVIEGELSKMDPVLAADLVLRRGYGYTMAELGAAQGVGAPAMWARLRRRRAALEHDG